MAPFYRWGSTASRLEPLRGGSLLFTTKFPEIPGTHFGNPALAPPPLPLPPPKKRDPGKDSLMSSFLSRLYVRGSVSVNLINFVPKI